MTFYKFLYNYLLPLLFRMQDHTRWFAWIPILGDVVRMKKRAVELLQLHKGDRVLVYSIGAGFELDFIMEKIGKEGLIVGVDFAEGMLGIAREKVSKNNWRNVTLEMADVKQYHPLNYKFDAVLSNFGYLDEAVLHTLIGVLKEGGRIAISGPQPLRGIRKVFYPITFVPEMAFGLTWSSLHRMLGHIEIIKKKCAEVVIDENTFAKYFFALSGRKYNDTDYKRT